MPSRARAAAVLAPRLALGVPAFLMHPGQLCELRRSTSSVCAPLSHVMFETSGRCAMSRSTRGAWSKRSRTALMAAEKDKEQKQLDKWDQLLSDDPKQKQMIGYLLAVTAGLLALGSAAYNFGGQLLGLGFADDRLGYWDAAPSYAILLVYPPLALLYPEAKGLLLKTLVASFLATCVIYFFPYDAIGWAPTNEHVLITVAVPVLSYLSYFVWRADRVYTEIAEEDAAARTANKDAAGDSSDSDR